ncbi:MAG: carbohydrate kinase [Kiritimatiellaeota bacterium]|nr:carbohydrate kinase [Kiritimatiellota bacterium]
MKPRVVGIGEILWDLLPSGRQLGGAPANFTYHAHALGAEARVVSRVGDDPLGLEILTRLRGLGLPTDGVGMDAGAPTGTVSVEVQADGQPRFTIHENVAWDRIAVDAASLEFASHADALCFGSLAQRCAASRAAIRQVISKTPATALRVFDINLRQHFYSRDLIESSLALANALKLNETELPVLAEMFALSGDARAQLAALAQRFELRAIALTRGAHGSLLLTDGAWSEHAGLPAKVVDAVGAGDAFTAAWTLGLLAGQPLDEINRRANELAAYVCTQPGATPTLPQHLQNVF